MKTLFKVLILVVSTLGVITQDPFDAPDGNVQPSVFTEGNHGNGTGHHDNQIFNSSPVHDNTTNNPYQTHGNKNAPNETYYPPYYESTTQQFDEKDLIFVNGTGRDTGSGEAGETIPAENGNEKTTTTTTEAPHPTEVLPMSDTTQSPQDGTGDPPAAPQPPSTTTTAAPGVDDVVVVCNENQCRSWYGDNYTAVPYFNAQDRQSCLRGCYPPPGEIICYVYLCVKWYPEPVPWQQYKKGTFECVGCYSPDSGPRTTTTTTTKPVTTTTQDELETEPPVVPPETPAPQPPPVPTPQPSPRPPPSAGAECNVSICILWYGQAWSTQHLVDDARCPSGFGCVSKNVTERTTTTATTTTTKTTTTTTIATTTVTTARENVSSTVPPTAETTTAEGVAVTPEDEKSIFENIGVLVGIAAGAFLLLVIVAAVFVHIRQKGKKNNQSKYPGSPPSKHDIQKPQNGSMYHSNGKVYYDGENEDLMENPAYGKQKLHYSKQSERSDSKGGRYTRPRDEPFYDKSQSARAPSGGIPDRRPSDGDRYTDFPQGPKPGSNDMKLYNNPAYEKKRKTSSKLRKGDEEDADLENYYTYPKHYRAENKYEKRPPLPSEKGKIKSGKEKIKKKTKDKKKKQKIDPSLYGEAFHNRAFEGDGPSGTVKSDASGIYESIRIPDPNYQSLDRNKPVDKNGTAHSTHGYLSIDRKQGKNDQTNFDALRFQPGVIDVNSNVKGGTSSNMTNDGYLEPTTLMRDGDKSKARRGGPDSRLELPQPNPLFQRLDSDDVDDAGYDKPKALRQDSGYHSQKTSQRSQKSSFKPKGVSRDVQGSKNSYAGYYPGDKRDIVYDPRSPNKYAEPYGTGAAVFQASDLQQNPLYQGSTSDLRSGGSRSRPGARSHKVPKDAIFNGSRRFGDVKEEQSMQMDMTRDPDDIDTLYDRADGHLSSKRDPLEDLYDRADSLKPANSDTRHNDGARLEDLYDRADSYNVPPGGGGKINRDMDALYDRADGLKHVHSNHRDPLDLYDRADNVVPPRSGKKRLPRQPVSQYDANSRRNYLQVIP